MLRARMGSKVPFVLVLLIVCNNTVPARADDGAGHVRVTDTARSNTGTWPAASKGRQVKDGNVLAANAFSAGAVSVPELLEPDDVSDSKELEIGPVADDVDSADSPVDWVHFQQPVPPPIAPVQPVTPEPFEMRPAVPSIVFGQPEGGISLLDEARRTRVRGPSTNLVFGSEGKFRVTTDAGSLLGKSRSASGVAVQSRTPIVNDPRIRGDRVGRLIASGSYWFPARQDLDTMLSKIDSRIVSDMILVKGPYAVRYGPGFSFVDLEFADTPRYACGDETHGASSLEYQTNGEQWYGRQSAWGGSDNYGYHVSYGHRTGSDYETGDNGFDLPSSYNSRDFELALGVDLSPVSTLDFHYLRLDQTNVEFPGLIHDINYLVTDGFDLAYTLRDQPFADQFRVEGWYNGTRFEGDTSRSGKNRQVPTLRPNFTLGPDQFFRTDADASSTGYRMNLSWGEADSELLTVGTDLIYLNQQLNEWLPERADIFPFPAPGVPITLPGRNFPLPRSHSVDIGLFVEHERALSDKLTVNAGARVDFVNTNARNNVPGTGEVVFSSPPPAFTLDAMTISELKDAGLDQSFFLWSLFMTADYKLDKHWNFLFGGGHAQRPPTLTELYAAGPYIGSLQPGFTFVQGDPELDPERLTQIDLGLRGDYGDSRLSANGFFAWIRDYITYDDAGITPFLTGSFDPGQVDQEAFFTNTDRAVLAGFELAAERDVNLWVTGFATLSYVEGRDLSRTTASRLGEQRRDDFNAPLPPPFQMPEERSGNPGVDHEPLPGIPPLESRLGVRVHEPVANPRWGAELEARVVDDQDRVALTLFEQATPGFTVWNLRSFWQATESLLLTAGVENFTDKFYAEHLDFHTGRGVFRPGVNFYFGSELTY